MIYLKIPDGCKVQIKDDKDAFVDIKTGAVFAYLSGKEGLVHQHHLNPKNKLIQIFSYPPDTSDLFLEYLPCNNGLNPTQWQAVVTGTEKNAFKNRSPSSARFFACRPEISLKRREELEEWHEDQRFNRRHSGDSPKCT